MRIRNTSFESEESSDLNEVCNVFSCIDILISEMQSSPIIISQFGESKSSQ